VASGQSCQSQRRGWLSAFVKEPFKFHPGFPDMRAISFLKAFNLLFSILFPLSSASKTASRFFSGYLHLSYRKHSLHLFKNLIGIQQFVPNSSCLTIATFSLIIHAISPPQSLSRNQFDRNFLYPFSQAINLADSGPDFVCAVAQSRLKNYPCSDMT